MASFNGMDLLGDHRSASTDHYVSTPSLTSLTMLASSPDAAVAISALHIILFVAHKLALLVSPFGRGFTTGLADVFQSNILWLKSKPLFVSLN